VTGTVGVGFKHDKIADLLKLTWKNLNLQHIHGVLG